jgi:hypothetical protein
MPRLYDGVTQRHAVNRDASGRSIAWRLYIDFLHEGEKAKVNPATGWNIGFDVL